MGAGLSRDQSGPVPDVILPVLDEAAAIPWVLGRMPAGCGPIVVDNGSDDGSADVARRARRAVVAEPRRGFGAACFAGLLAATADVVCFMDCDGSLDPRDLPRVARAVGASADLVLGARCPSAARGRCTRGWRTGRGAGAAPPRSGSRCATWGRCAPRRARPLLGLGIEDRRFGWPLEMVLRAAAAGWRIDGGRPSPTTRASGRSKVTGTVRGHACATVPRHGRRALVR